MPLQSFDTESMPTRGPTSVAAADRVLHVLAVLAQHGQPMSAAELMEATGLALWDYRFPFTDVYLTARWGELIGDVAMEGSWKTDDLVGRLHPDDAPRVEHELRRLIKGEVQRASGEYRFKTAEGWIWLETHAMVVETDTKGRVS